MRIAIVGAGRVGGHHADALAAFPDHSIAAFADPNLDLARQMADRYGGEAYADYREMLDRCDCQAVVVGVPHCLHREVTVAALQAGKHVLLEKPMACSVAECDEIIAAQQRHGPKLMIGYTHHFMPTLRTAREIIRGGQLGQLVLGEDVMAYGQVEPESERQIKWLLRRDMAGGGTIMNNGSHSLGRIMWLTGQHVVAVYAACGNARPDLTHIDVELHTLGMLHLSGGAVISLWQDAYGQRQIGRNDFTGTAGALSFGTSGPVTLYRDSQAEEMPPGDYPPAWQAEWQEFLGCIAQDREPAINGTWGRRVVEIAQAMYESSARRQVVELPPPVGLS
jgi:predicted dehydrogenase